MMGRPCKFEISPGDWERGWFVGLTYYEGSGGTTKTSALVEREDGSLLTVSIPNGLVFTDRDEIKMNRRGKPCHCQR